MDGKHGRFGDIRSRSVSDQPSKTCAASSYIHSKVQIFSPILRKHMAAKGTFSSSPNPSLSSFLILIQGPPFSKFTYHTSANWSSIRSVPCLQCAQFYSNLLRSLRLKCFSACLILLFQRGTGCLPASRQF